MNKFKLGSVQEINGELLQKLIDTFKTTDLPKLQKLMDYYNGKQDILTRTKAGDKPNNKINNPWARHISNTAQSYFIGEPIKYQSTDEQLMQQLQHIFDSNNEESQNFKLARDASAVGIGYELVYLDEEGELKFDIIEPTNAFIIYDNTIKQSILAGVRFYSTHDYMTDEQQLYAEVYTADTIQYYKEDEGELILVDEVEHYFNAVPMIPYFNNLELIGDYEPVMTLIDAYDILQSDSVNNLEELANSYLLIKGVEIDAKSAKAMKENRIINISDDGDAYFVERSNEPTEIEELKMRLVDDIHRLSGVPDLSAQRFAGSESSGAALRYKIMNLENLTKIKERYFTHSLRSRLKLIINYLNLKGHSFEYQDVSMQFTRNLAADIEGLTDIVTKLNGVVSDKTLLSMLPFIENVDFELELLKQQEESTLDSYDSIFDEDETEEE